MNIKRWVQVIIGVVLVSFSVGLLSLRYNDKYKFISPTSNDIINIRSNEGTVKMGKKGIEIKDGNDNVSIGWRGINISDGYDRVSIGWDGIKIKEGNNSSVRIHDTGNWFNFGSKKLQWETINKENLIEIDDINTITVSSPFVDIKITSEDRNDVRMHYHGKMKSNVVPNLEFKTTAGVLSIELENSKEGNYTVTESDVVLEIFVPESFNSNFNTSTSSGDIFMKNLSGKNFNISTSSGDIELETVKGKMLNLAASSGNIDTEDCIGEVSVYTSSGDISLDNEKASDDIKISSSSGDVFINFGDDANYKVDGTTSSGEINYNGPISVEKDKSGKFEFTIGSGDKSMVIITSSGDIHFSKK